MEGKKDVFLMYSKKDDAKVKELVSLFDENGITYLDSYSSSNPQTEILNCKCMVFVSSENSRTLECEALKSYIPFAKKSAVNIGKIEYVLDPSNTKIPLVAKIVLKGFFTQEPCVDEESLIEAILPYVLESEGIEEVENPIIEDIEEESIIEETIVSEEAQIEEIPVIDESAQPDEEILEQELPKIDEISDDEDDYEEIIVGVPFIEEQQKKSEEESLDNVSEETIEEPLNEETNVEEAKVEIIEEIKRNRPLNNKTKEEDLEEDLPEADFDVFLCYKERDFFKGSERENDSRDVRDIYLFLQREGFKVFTKDESLVDIKTPQGKEVFTKRAIESAKVMVLYTSKPEFTESLFVKKDWISYYTSMTSGQKKPNSMVSVYKNFSPEKLPHPVNSFKQLNKNDTDFKYKLKEFILNSFNAEAEQQAKEEKQQEVKTIKLTKTKEKIVSKGFTYVLSKNGSYSIKLGHATDVDLVLPAEYKGQKIEGIAKEGFADALYIESVFIPKSYLEVKESAFSGCVNLKKVIFEDESELETINPKAFFGCANLKELDLPRSIVSIKKNAFENAGLESIFIPASVDEIEENVFEKCQSLKTIHCAINEPGSEWNDDWDSNCLAKVVWGDVEEETSSSDEKALELVFETDPSTSSLTLVKCESQEKVVEIPAEINGHVVTKIKEGAFFDNEIIETVNIPKGIKIIEESAFEGCTHLTNIYFDAEDCENFEPYNKVFANAGIKNYGLTVRFSANVKHIPENLFYPENGPKRVPNIVEVIFENGFSCEKIRDYAFAYAKNLSRIEIPSSIKVIGVNAFVGCSDLKEIVLPNSVEEIENYSFSGCSSLQNIDLPCSIRKLGAGVFSYCRNLESLTIPSNVTNLGEKAFSDCGKMKTLKCCMSKQPASWDSDWDKSCRAEIVWG